MRIFKTLAVALTLAMTLGSLAMAQGNPCNPCNPCGGKKMKMKNPCGMGTHFHIDNAKNTATFTSDAPLESIVGTTNKITGHIMFDPKNPKKGGSGMLSLDVASINTGIPMRDEHLRSADWLDAKKYPAITFEITKVKKIKETKSTKSAKTFEVTLEGNFTVHGVTKKISVPGTFSYMAESDMTKMQGEGNLLIGRTSFEVKLSDYNIPSNKYKAIVGAKVGESITISVSFFGSDQMAMAGNPCNPCNPCGGKKAMNPCNPCGGKKAKNPCNPCNPCGM